MNYFQKNRQDFYKSIKDNSLVYLYSGALKQQSADENYAFTCNMNFYYLTGIRQDNVYLLLSKIKGVIKEVLFIAENDPTLVKWIGASLYKDEASKISEIQDVRYLSELPSYLNEIVNIVDQVYLDQEVIPFDGQRNFVQEFEKQITAIKKVEIIDAYPLIASLRGIKKDYEIDLFKKDVELTRIGLEEVLQNLKDCEYEYQVQAIFEKSIMFHGHAVPSFFTISASGVNGATLHYSANKKKLNRDDLILLDLGANCNLYHADISRTYPISGKFNPLQRTIYEIVLNCNKYIIRNIRPGISIPELQKMTIDFLATACLDKGLIKEKEEIKNYYFHNVSHHIGLDTHDPYPDRQGPLKEGMIISCEPGLYFENLGIGVRIEDDILVTKDGCENLSKDIIKEIDDIEKYIQKYQNK